MRRDGTVKVLDFGLAKALDAGRRRGAVPTRAWHTRPALVMGTPAYMSPEQARGEAAVDRSADIWAFGVILYEVLTGISPFARHTTADTLASVLGAPPDYALLPPNTPSPIRHLIRRCLERDRKRRWQHMGDARIELEEALREVGGEGHSDSVADTGTGGRARPRLLWIAATAIVVVAVAAFFGALVAWTTRQPEAPEEMSTSRRRRPRVRSRWRFRRTADARVRRQLRRKVSAVASETERSCRSRSLRNRKRCFSRSGLPNSREIAFSVETDLKRINIDSGVVQTVAPYVSGGGGAWTEDRHPAGDAQSSVAVNAGPGDGWPGNTCHQKHLRISMAIAFRSCYQTVAISCFLPEAKVEESTSAV